MEYFHDIIMLIKDNLITENKCLKNWEGAESCLAHTKLKVL